jgi:Copper type II ascorbate-dependent monooxygenase, C-terminal domain
MVSDASRSVPLGSIRDVPARLAVAVMACGAQSCDRAPTYYEDVRPILSRSCAPCHSRGGVAPTPRLETLEEITSALGKIRLAVKMRDMPPWGAENTGLCGTWKGALWLPDAELRTLVKWTENPIPGDPKRARDAPRPAEPSFRSSGLVADIGGDFRPGLGPDAYRCFVTEPGVTKDAVATAFRATSTERRSVEHVALYASDSPETDAALTALDAIDPALGYSCYGSSGVSSARLLASFTWDSPVLRMPRGYGVRLRAGRKVVVQIHYNPIATGLGVPTRTRIEIEVDDRAREASFLTVSPGDFRLEPRRTHVEAHGEATLPHAFRLLGVAPRMHSLGKVMQLDRNSDADWACTGSFDHWNFYRQRFFELEKPLDLRAGTRLRVSCAYDTESRAEPVRMGDAIDEEECVAALLVAGG